MHKNVTHAVMRLQARLRAPRSHRVAEQTEEALNLLLNQPENSSEPHRQIRNALSEAGKKLRRRSRLLDAHHERPPSSRPSDGLDAVLALELRDFVDRAVRPLDRPLLRQALAGAGAEGVATEFGIPLDRARERLSRARTRALPLWLN